ncbi:MAG: hypothetical protein NT090_02235, partial [Acidobacteria bacterium]|nr:hypothetical protein [Acidobacteriota bacterium]
SAIMDGMTDGLPHCPAESCRGATMPRCATGLSAHTGMVLKIVPEQRVSKLSRLKKRAGFDGDPDDIIGMDWLKQRAEVK